MTQQERIQKYKKEYCSRCKNKDKYDCDIRVFTIDKTIYTKCINYEKDKEKIEGYKDKIKMSTTANKNKPIMKGINK